MGSLLTTVPEHGGQQSYVLVRWGQDSHNLTLVISKELADGSGETQALPIWSPC